MTKAVRGIFYISVALQCLLFSGCSPNNSGDLSGIEGTGSEEGDLIAARGAVTQFGSIYVNGIHFNTETATFYQDGAEISEEALKQGMVVYVEGTQGDSDSEAVASEVHFDYLLQGRIEQISTLGSSQRQIQMLGYKVVLSEDAMLAIDLFDSLKEGDTIAVSGLLKGEAAIFATRIDTIDTQSAQTIVGYVDEHLSTQNIIRMGSLEIDTSAATIFGNDELEAGNLIKVTGSKVDQTLFALKIKHLNAHGFSSVREHRSISDEGIVETVNSDDTFILNGVKVNTTHAKWTGRSESLINTDDRVSVTGRLDENGTLIAQTVHVHSRSSNQLSGEVSNINIEDKTITVSGLTFIVDQFTRFEDWGPRRNRYFGLGDIQLGDSLDAFIRNEGADSTAITVRRKPKGNFEAPFRLTIKGRIEDFNPELDTLRLANIHVDLSQLQSASEQLENGREVIIVGTYDDNRYFVASEIKAILPGCTTHRDDFCDWQRGFDKEDPDRERGKLKSLAF